MTATPASTVRIDSRCTACGLCLATCPEGALIRAVGRPGVIDDRCTGCLACIEVCPVDAIREAAGPQPPTARDAIPATRSARSVA